jgi:lia operon protein LiaG
MRRVVINLIMIAVISLAVGTVILFVSNGGKIASIGKEVNAINDIKEESIEGADEINISSTSAHIIVVSEKRNNIKAELIGRGSADNVGIKTSFNGGKLDIQVENKITVGINFSIEELKLYVYVPEDYSKKLSVKSTSGKIEIGDMKLKELACKVTSGSVEFKKVVAEKFDYSNTSGSLKAGILDTKQSILKSTSGSIKIESFIGELKCTQTSGSIDVNYKAFNNSAELDSVSGSIKLGLPSNAEFGLDARSTSGSVYSEFPITIEGTHNRNKLIGYVKSKNNKISIKTTSGSIKIDKTS